MSAILVVLDLRGDRVDEALFDSMLRSIDERGRDGSGKWVGGPIGLGHQSTALTPEEVGETQPVQLGSLAGVFEGRLDNRDELLSVFAPTSRGAPTLTDAELCVQAYHKWGSATTSHLIGEFGFAIWDAAQRVLFCARDRLGIRPIYYWNSGRTLVLSTDLRAVLAHPECPCEPNQTGVADYLLWRSTSRIETLYAGVYRLEPARTLRVEDGSLKLDQYWQVELTDSVEEIDDREWVERLEDVLNIALRGRMRACDAPTIALSGGLDSSLLLALAVRASRLASAESRGVTAASLVFAGMDCDEEPYIRYVTDRLGMEALRLSWSPISWDEILAEAQRISGAPPYPNTTVDMFVRAGIQSRVVLTGSGGDQWMNGYESFYAELVKERRIRELGLHLMRGGGRTGARVAWLALRARTLDRCWPRVEADPRPPWLGPALRATVSRPKSVANVRSRAGNAHSKRWRLATLQEPWETHVFEVLDQAGAKGHLTLTHPFYDSRVVEFVFKVPEAQRWRGSDRRWLERRALQRSALQRIARRRTEAVFREPFEAQLARLPLQAILRDSRAAALGWIDTEAALHALGAKSGLKGYSVESMWCMIAIEAWLRSVWG